MKKLVLAAVASLSFCAFAGAPPPPAAAADAKAEVKKEPAKEAIAAPVADTAKPAEAPVAKTEVAKTAAVKKPAPVAKKK